MTTGETQRRTRRRNVALPSILAILVGTAVATQAFADTPEEAEAKLRGVSVDQVKLEHQLAKEFARIQELEKEVAALKAQLAQKSAAAVATPSTSASTKPALF